MKFHLYKGFEVAPYPYQLTKGGCWVARVAVTRPATPQSCALVRAYTDDASFPNKEDAEARALELGKQIVDGNHPRFSLGEMRD